MAGIPTTLLEAAVWAVALSGFFQAKIRRSWINTAKAIPKPILFLVGLFFLSAVISTVISPHLETSLGILKGWIVTPLVYAFLVYAALTTSSASPRVGFSFSRRSTSPYEGEVSAHTEGEVLKHWIITALVLSGLVVALLGLSQLGQLDRVQGPYDVPNSLALYLAPIIVLAWRAYSIFGRLAAAVMFLALLFTESLAGVVSVLIAVGAGLFILQRNPLSPPYQGEKQTSSLDKGRMGGVLILVGVVATFLLVPKIHYLQQPGSSAQVRLQLWSISWDLIRERPLLGVGLGTFEPAYQAKLHERFTEYESAPLPEFVFRDPHNWLLSFWLNTGLLGLASFVTIHAYIFFKTFLPLTKGEWLPAAAVGVSTALLALLLLGLADTIYWKNDLATLHWLFIALLISASQRMV